MSHTAVFGHCGEYHAADIEVQPQPNGITRNQNVGARVGIIEEACLQRFVLHQLLIKLS